MDSTCITDAGIAQPPERQKNINSLEKQGKRMKECVELVTNWRWTVETGSVRR